MKPARQRAPVKVLVVDVGGSHDNTLIDNDRAVGELRNHRIGDLGGVDLPGLALQEKS